MSVDAVFQALGDPTRRALLERLGEGPLSVSELAAPLACLVNDPGTLLLSKPFRKADLAKIIRRALDHGLPPGAGA